MSFKLNQRGAYVALIGLMVFILVVSVSFMTLSKGDSVRGKTLIKIAGDVKRTFEKYKFLVDKAISDKIARQVILQGCNSSGNFDSAVSTTLTELTEKLRQETGIECNGIRNSSISSNVPFTIRLNCSFLVSAGDQIRYAASTSGIFTLKKAIEADNSSGSCRVTVTDSHSELVDVVKTG